MTRVQVYLDEPVAERLRTMAGQRSLSATAAELLHQAVLDQACAAVAAYERAHDDPEDEAARLAGQG